MYMAEAYALRGYAQLLLTNIYGHQIKSEWTRFFFRTRNRHN